MLLGTLRMKAEPAKREELLRIMRATIGPTRVMRGCISCLLSRAVDDDNLIAVHTRWGSRDDLNAYLRTREFKGLLVAMDLLQEPPEVTFDNVSHSEGLEMVEKARRHEDVGPAE